MEFVFEYLQNALGFLLSSWLPPVLTLMALWVSLRSRDATPERQSSTRLLVLAEGLCAITWGTLYGEHLSDGRIGFFDAGAPVVALLSLLLLPTMLFLVIYRHRVIAAVRGKSFYLVSIPLLVLTIIPGIYLLWLYVGLALSDR